MIRINIIDILHSIKDVRLDSERNLQVKFNNPDPVYSDEWESISGYVHGSFTEELLILIEDALQGKLPTDSDPSPNGRQSNKIE